MFFHQRFIPGLAVCSYLNQDVRNVLAGMSAWKAAGLPTVA
jgi:hypothetical protein